MNRQSAKVLIAREALSIMVSGGRAALPHETGGILAGFRTDDHVVVTRAAIVPDSQNTSVEYRCSIAAAALALATLRGDAPSVVGYVGDWHTHPANCPPSATDIASLREIAAAACDIVALIVLPFDGETPCFAYAHIGHPPRSTAHRARRSQTRPVTVAIADRAANVLEQIASAALTREEISQP